MSAHEGARPTAWRGTGRARSLLVEILTIGALYVLYRQIRVLVRHQEIEAIGNAARVIHFERAIGLFTERDLQSWVISDRAIVWLLDRYYVTMHFTVTTAVTLWAFFRYRSSTYSRMKFLLITVTIVGLALHVTFPLAPPRMLTDHGFIDTLARYGPNIYPRDTSASVANQFAAMPSLHFGWSLIVAVCVSATYRGWWAKAIWIHPTLTLLAIVGTGNHYWLDAIVAGLLVVVADLVWRRRVPAALRPSRVLT